MRSRELIPELSYAAWNISQQAHEWMVEQSLSTGDKIRYVVKCAMDVRRPPRSECPYREEMPQSVYVARLIEALEKLEPFEAENYLEQRGEPTQILPEDNKNRESLPSPRWPMA